VPCCRRAPPLTRAALRCTGSFLGDLKVLVGLPALCVLRVAGNPLARIAHFRRLAIRRLPGLLVRAEPSRAVLSPCPRRRPRPQVLDDVEVTPEERMGAARMYSSKPVVAAGDGPLPESTSLVAVAVAATAPADDSPLATARFILESVAAVLGHPSCPAALRQRLETSAEVGERLLRQLAGAAPARTALEDPRLLATSAALETLYRRQHEEAEARQMAFDGEVAVLRQQLDDTKRRHAEELRRAVEAARREAAVGTNGRDLAAAESASSRRSTADDALLQPEPVRRAADGRSPDASRAESARPSPERRSTPPVDAALGSATERQLIMRRESAPAGGRSLWPLPVARHDARAQWCCRAARWRAAQCAARRRGRAPAPAPALPCPPRSARPPRSGLCARPAATWPPRSSAARTPSLSRG
jgi:hypothetical protein